MSSSRFSRQRQSAELKVVQEIVGGRESQGSEMEAVEGLIAAAEFLDPDSGWFVIDARSGSEARSDFLRAHLEGAVFADLEIDLAEVPADAAEGGRHPLPSVRSWCESVGKWGIGPATRVAVYDDHGGALAAARVWWMLRAIGHRRVALIDGGWQALKQAGAAIEAGPSSRSPGTAAYPGPSDWLLPTVGIDGVQEWRRAAGKRLVDVRSRNRYLGLEEPFDPIAGHIPGAVNAPYAAVLNADGTVRRTELKEFADRSLAGSDPGDVAFYCGSGVTACYALFALHLAGVEGATLYPGSWGEWCRRELPRASVVTPD